MAGVRNTEARLMLLLQLRSLGWTHWFPCWNICWSTEKQWPEVISLLASNWSFNSVTRNTYVLRILSITTSFILSLIKLERILAPFFIPISTRGQKIHNGTIILIRQSRGDNSMDHVSHFMSLLLFTVIHMTTYCKPKYFSDLTIIAIIATGRKRYIFDSSLRYRCYRARRKSLKILGIIIKNTVDLSKALWYFVR